jgi:hypothetical protein
MLQGGDHAHAFGIRTTVLALGTDVGRPFHASHAPTDLMTVPHRSPNTIAPVFADLLLYLTESGLFVFRLSALAVPVESQAQTPTVDRVEPANWWTAMQWNEVQLMV